ncbi:hypothetical protein [Alicyclobacillus sp. SO9]|uniref:hypothetical protein n=1 Tax=Alicyclobacillus sp. SO9 TaxID=2665646 RepID=UPI0018E87525|nr:hypothetical protein [Alicyclobacillus sp. SO9]QQE77082.1 hypothetical protein GI364_13960 [Alicyclobacillus sp. SO9]
MSKFICTTCGTQYTESESPPDECQICNEERQYVNPNGQSWTTLEEMTHSGTFRNEFLYEEDGLYSVTTTPRFAIGQTAYVVKTNDFSLLWDCITYMDDETLRAVRREGGINAMALSHPHYYSTQVEWAETLDVPIYIHEADRKWVMRPNWHIQFWSGDVLKLSEGLTLHRLGGHFEGGTVLHWEHGYNDNGILLTGDIIQVVADMRWVSFMYSYPNLIPLPARKVAEIGNRVSALKFKRIYNAFHRVIRDEADEAVKRSVDRYIAALEGRLFNT